MDTRARTERCGVVGIGYERRSLDDLVSGLVAAEVALVVDVRLTPISRRPGLSKTALAHALADAGIDYWHRPQLGNPKTNRSGFAGPAEELSEARSVFRALLDRPESCAALDEVAAAARRQMVGVLCYEADQQRCHRDVVLQAVAARTATDAGGRRPAR